LKSRFDPLHIGIRQVRSRREAQAIFKQFLGNVTAVIWAVGKYRLQVHRFPQWPAFNTNAPQMIMLGDEIKAGPLTEQPALDFLIEQAAKR